MGYLKDVHSNKDTQAFPGAEFEIAGEVPAPQCSEAKIESILGFTNEIGPILFDTGKFVGWNLAGKKITITFPLDMIGTFDINDNLDDLLVVATELIGPRANINYYIHNGGSLILTRNVTSFTAFIRAAGYAYTIKGGKLYTNIPAEFLQPACTILFDPLT